MTIKTVTNFKVLMMKAQKAAKARRKGDLAEIEKAEADHDAYVKLCMASDEMSLGIPRSELDPC